jgi:hypothetical protein
LGLRNSKFRVAFLWSRIEKERRMENEKLLDLVKAMIQARDDLLEGHKTHEFCDGERNSPCYPAMVKWMQAKNDLKEAMECPSVILYQGKAFVRNYGLGDFGVDLEEIESVTVLD